MAEQQIHARFMKTTPKKKTNMDKYQDLITYYLTAESMLAALLNVQIDDPSIQSHLKFTNWYVGNNNFSKRNIDMIIDRATYSKSIQTQTVDDKIQ